jgi:N,N'-diacetyllegionaminate synthase
MSDRALFTPRGSCFVMAEVAQSHDGSLGQAHAFIDAAAKAGANAIKFQTHIAAAESTPSEPWRVRFSRQDETRYQYWQRMEFTEEQWAGLAVHARERGLAFLSSPFSVEAAELLLRVEVDAWKVASGEIAGPALIDLMRQSGLPIIVSTGMSPLTEIDQAVAALGGARPSLAVLQCTSLYPTPAESVGLNVLADFRRRYDGAAVGLSDHSGTIWPGLAGAAIGMDVLEVHVAFSRQMFGPDVSSSVTFEELGTLIEGIRYTERMLANPVDKDAMANRLADYRRLFFKSVVAAVDLAAGTTLLREQLCIRKPGTGIPAAQLEDVIGRRLRNDVARDHVLTEGDLS